MSMPTFDTLQPGQALGRHAWSIDADAVAAYREIYELPAGARMPAGLLTVAVMRAFMAALDGAPPGSLHAGQRMAVERLPRLDEPLLTEIACMDKAIRHERRWLRFGFVVTGDGERAVARGVNTSIFPY